MGWIRLPISLKQDYWLYFIITVLILGEKIIFHIAFCYLIITVGCDLKIYMELSL